MNKKVMTGLFAGMGVCVLFAGCSRKEEEAPPQEAPVAVIESEPEEKTTVKEPERKPENTHKGEAKSLLTGQWINKKLAKKRPVSCMLGNTQSALPQYGISQADVIYEAPVEGGLTRLMGIFQDYETIEKLGSVRSSRLYYAYYSMGFDAIYLHYGQASYATGFLQSGQIDDLNGLDYEVDKAVIYRDSSRKAPHNAYATGEGLLAGLELKQYRTEYRDGFEGHYKFAADDAPVKLNGKNSKKADVVRAGYLANEPYFEYNAKDGLYYRYQYGSQHTDGSNGEQLAVKNIIVQNSAVRTLDDNGYLEIATTGEGTGWFVTNGKMIDITWKCGDSFSPTRYYDGDGNEITLNQGKTWVCIVDQAHPERVQFEEQAATAQ